MNTTPLFRLPNGAWVRPSSVTAIKPLPTETGVIGHLHRARVVVHHLGMAEVILANDNAHAQTIADELSAAFNQTPQDPFTLLMQQIQAMHGRFQKEEEAADRIEEKDKFNHICSVLTELTRLGNHFAGEE